jgi:hypothetical protein
VGVLDLDIGQRPIQNQRIGENNMAKRKVTKEVIQKKTWDEFREAKLFWYINRMLHLFGWALVYELDEDSLIRNVYPAHVRFRGFSEEIETSGFLGLTKHIKKNISRLEEESKE